MTQRPESVRLLAADGRGAEWRGEGRGGAIEVITLLKRVAAGSGVRRFARTAPGRKTPIQISAKKARNHMVKSSSPSSSRLRLCPT
jgi:hypothetical protein